eukprot:6202706-Pleurochrysis_carterae.AAC.1
MIYKWDHSVATLPSDGGDYTSLSLNDVNSANQNSRLDDHDGVAWNSSRVEEVHGVRNDKLMLPTFRDLFVQRLAQLGVPAGVVDLLQMRLRDVADHGLACGRCTSELHVRSIAWKGNNGRHRERHGIALPVEEHLIAHNSQDSR